MRYLLHSAYLTAISKNLLSISFRSASESSLICRSISSSLTVIKKYVLSRLLTNAVTPFSFFGIYAKK